MPELITVADTHHLDAPGRMKRSDIVFTIVRAYLEAKVPVTGSGVLQVANDGHGFLRNAGASYVPGSDDIHLSSQQIRKFRLSTGDLVKGQVRLPNSRQQHLALERVIEINGEPLNAKRATLFENLTPMFPDEWLDLEMGNGSSADTSLRLVDLVSPVGKGQRGLIVSPPKAGKTVLLQAIANGLAHNHPDSELMVLLIDERPEEVTDMDRSVRGTVIASTFDEAPQRHVQVAEMVLQRARRLVEQKRDVVILLDSITRLARAYNTVQPQSGRVLTGGVDASALEKPKRFFGAARNVEGGGSLTIIATALSETGSKMDDVIYEEFKGTGNMELHLDRKIAERRIFPAINVQRSGTRRDDLIVGDEQLRLTVILRRLLAKMDDVQATEFMIDRMKQTKTNSDFFDMMKRQAGEQTNKVAAAG